MSGTTTSQALEKADTSPKALVKKYEQSFMQVLPSHVKPETWVRVAQGALKKGKKVDGTNSTELEIAAQNDPGIFLATLLDAARMGLEPGTEQYYLTPRKEKGKLKILGIVGYQGYIELMYRAGAVTSVVAEVVRSSDVFVWAPGQLDTEMLRQGLPPRWDGPQTIPFHGIDWDSDDRGDLRLVYAYAQMKGGATSKVVVLNRAQIEKIKEKAQNPTGQYSPWRNEPEAMWLKSAVRLLRKWVPTSNEYVGIPTAPPPARDVVVDEDLPPIPDLPAEFPDDDIEIEGEVVDDNERPFE